VTQLSDLQTVDIVFSDVNVHALAFHCSACNLVDSGNDVD
jgi:hypothetical protein